MPNLNTVEIKAFVPARDFEISKQFYQDLGFTMASCGGGVAYFHFGNNSFLLQDFHKQGYTENFMMHLLVEDVEAWFEEITRKELMKKYNVKISRPENQPWKMRDFVLYDPSGVLWRIGQNID
ncbi:MAG: VOC family protein [Gammaproteobacteria bacterium]